MNKLAKTVARLKEGVRSRLEADERRICFSHVPKCGGSSIGRSLSRQMYSFWERRALPRFSINIRASERTARALGNPMVNVREEVLAYILSNSDHRMAGGHVACRPALVKAYSKEWQFVTVLRDPVQRWLSEFVYNTLKSSDWAKNSLPIKEYVESTTGQYVGATFLRYFSSMPDTDIHNSMDYVDEAEENLASFAVVGILEDLDRFSHDIHLRFGKRIRIPVSNQSPSNAMKSELLKDDALMNRIRELCEADSLLYQRIRERVMSRP